MTLLRWSLICAVTALVSLLLDVSHLYPGNSFLLGFYLFITGSVILGSLGAFVFRKY
jgi:hypothetical protein